MHTVSAHQETHSDTALPSYADFAARLYRDGILTDAWIDGRPRFTLQGVVLTVAQAEALRRAAERVGAVYQELIEILWDTPTLLDDYFHLTPYQKLMWFAAQGRWHGIARADLFRCGNGQIQCCEVNSDTPSGEAEAVLLNRLLLPYHPRVRDPNRHFPQAFWRMLVASHGGHAPRTVGIIYPTELTEDLSMIALYRAWLEDHGCQVLLGSPYNLHACGAGVGLFGEQVELIIRHYKTDWWGERETVWRDAPPYPDAEPLHGPLRLLLQAEYAGMVTVVNPFGTVLSQNKLTLALMWEAQQRFSARARRWIRRYIPPTYRLSQMPAATLLAEQAQWVVKSAYGCEGEETVCGPFVSQETWQDTIAHALPQAWVCQRFFDVQPELHGALGNYGVYLIGGRSVGMYTRLSPVSTTSEALTAPTFVACPATSVGC